MQELITSRENPQIKRAAALLARKKYRDETGLFLAEGFRLCSDAVKSGARLETLFLTRAAGERYAGADLLRKAAGHTLWIHESLADKLGDTKSPQGVFAIFEKLDIRRCAVTIKRSGHYLLLENLQNPGNLGTVLRTADALGIDGVLLSRDCPDLYSPKVLRGAMGGVFRLPFTVCENLAVEIAALRQAGVPVYAAALREDGQVAGTVDFSGGGAVLIGNEGAGLPEELIVACTGSVRIPMSQAADSLNAAVAASILLWEMRRNTDGGR